MIVVVGEDRNDAKAVVELLRALRPDYTGSFEALRSPMLLSREHNAPGDRKRAEAVAALLDATSVTHMVIALFVHQDCDDFEPADIALAVRIENALRAAGSAGLAVVPAWEMETWWFQWPEVARRVVASWRVPDDFVGREVGMIQDAKEAYRRAVRAGGAPEYRESHSPELAGHVRATGVARTPRANSGSYRRFVEKADALVLQT